MSRRDECIIDTYEDAKQWLEMYRDTITDEQVVRVTNVLYCTKSEELDYLQNQISCKEDQIQELGEQLKERDMKIARLEAELYVLEA